MSGADMRGRAQPAMREPAVAGAFYPGRADVLADLVGRELETAAAVRLDRSPLAVLVPHAGLVYSGAIAAAGWRALVGAAVHAPTVVILGTNHSAWFDGVAVDTHGAWRLPTGDVGVDGAVAARILALGGPFFADRAAHRGEHSIEVQIPFLRALRPDARIVACSVAAGVDEDAVAAGRRLGALLSGLRAEGLDVLLAISTDMAHYPVHDEAVRVTERLLPAICALDPLGTATLEREAAASSTRGMVCGMCGIQPTVLGLAAAAVMGATRGHGLAAATSADAGGPRDRTVGYLAAAFS